MCRKEDPFKPTENWPRARRETWETARRGTTEPFPGSIPPTLQLHKRPREETTVGTRSSTTATREPCLLDPRTSTLTIDGHIWVSPGLWFLRLQDTQPRSVLLPRLLSWTGGDSAIQRLWTPSTDWKETIAPWGRSSSCQSKRVTTRWFWWAFVKNFQQRTVIFSRAEQGSAADRNALQQTALEQIHSCTVPGLTDPWVGQHTHSFVTDIQRNTVHPPPLVEGGPMGLWWAQNNTSARRSPCLPQRWGSPQKHTLPHFRSSTKLLSPQGCDFPNEMTSRSLPLCAAALLLDPEPTFPPSPLPHVEHYPFSWLQFIRRGKYLRRNGDRKISNRESSCLYGFCHKAKAVSNTRSIRSQL